MRGIMNVRVFLPLLLLAPLAAGCSKDEEPAFAPVSVVSLYDARVKGLPAGSLGVHVADVGIGPKGAKLMSAPDPEIKGALEAALADLATRPFAPTMSESAGEKGTSMDAEAAKPGDERYPWAVGGFLRERTGLRYDVKPYKKP
jgi:hypothetical protein